MTEEERKIYEKYLINLAKDRDVVNTAKEEGIEEGMKEGMKKGEKIGVKKKAKNTTIKLIKRSISNKEISEITDLSISEIEEICNEMKNNDK